MKNSRTHDRYLHELLSFHYGCVLAYDEGYESNDCIFASALWRNLFTMDQNIEPFQLNKMVQYVRGQMHYLHSIPVEQLSKTLALQLPQLSEGKAKVDEKITATS